MNWRSRCLFYKIRSWPHSGIVDPTKVVLCLAGEQRRAANHDRVMVAENDKTSSRMLNGGMPEAGFLRDAGLVRA
jgi:hypothetical protein